MGAPVKFFLSHTLGEETFTPPIRGLGENLEPRQDFGLCAEISRRKDVEEINQEQQGAEGQRGHDG